MNYEQSAAFAVEMGVLTPEEATALDEQEGSGTTEGAKKAWDTRGRNQGERALDYLKTMSGMDTTPMVHAFLSPQGEFIKVTDHPSDISEAMRAVGPEEGSPEDHYTRFMQQSQAVRVRLDGPKDIFAEMYAVPSAKQVEALHALAKQRGATGGDQEHFWYEIRLPKSTGDWEEYGGNYWLDFERDLRNLRKQGIHGSASGYRGDNKEIGTPESGYSVDGPFKCGKCEHFHPGDEKGTCDHPAVLKDAKAGHLPLDDEEHPVVSATGCCTFFRPADEQEGSGTPEGAVKAWDTRGRKAKMADRLQRVAETLHQPHQVGDAGYYKAILNASEPESAEDRSIVHHDPMKVGQALDEFSEGIHNALSEKTRAALPDIAHLRVVDRIDGHEKAVGLYHNQEPIGQGQRGYLILQRDANIVHNMYHEFGHHIDYALGVNRFIGDKYPPTVNTTPEFEALRRGMLLEYAGMKGGPSINALNAVTKYALTSEKEWFAESFEWYMRGGVARSSLEWRTPKTYALIKGIADGTVIGAPGAPASEDQPNARPGAQPGKHHPGFRGPEWGGA